MDRDWPSLAKGIIRAEMVKRQISYAALSEKLKEIGVNETAGNLRTKLSRGSFSAVFLIQVMTALGVTSLRID